MGQRVNVILFRSGVTSFWDNSLSVDRSLISLFNNNYLLNLATFFLRRKNIRAHYFKYKLIDNIFNIYIYYYQMSKFSYFYVPKKKIKRKALFCFKYLKKKNAIIKI